jgi:hypothetical protein
MNKKTDWDSIEFKLGGQTFNPPSFTYAPQDVRERIDILVAKFEDGERRYNYSATLNKIIDSLGHGADPIKIIDQLATIIDEQQLVLTDLLKKCTPPSKIILTREEYERFLKYAPNTDNPS